MEVGNILRFELKRLGKLVFLELLKASGLQKLQCFRHLGMG